MLHNIPQEQIPRSYVLRLGGSCVCQAILTGYRSPLILSKQMIKADPNVRQDNTIITQPPQYHYVIF